MSILLRSIHKVYGGYLKLNGLDLKIENGTFLGIVAPTGMGKTTLLRVMAGIEKPDAGQIMVNDRDVTHVHVRQRNVAMVYQQFINYPSLTVYENIASPLRVQRKYDATEIRRRVEQMAEQLQISPFLSRLPQELSGGQQQRVAIARALVKEADLILLDEPLGNLDYKLREDLRLELKQLAAARETIFVYATPEAVDALTMCSHVAILHDGRIIQHGPTREVYRRPTHVQTGRYFGDPPMNFLPCHVAHDEAILENETRIPLQRPVPSGDYLLGIRPHRLRLDKPADDPSVVPLAAQVKLAEIVGSDTTLHLTHRGLDLILQWPNLVHFDLDEAITVYLNPKQLHIFDPHSGQLVQGAVTF